MAIVLETPTDLAVPIDTAFSLLSDQRNEKEWNPSCRFVELLTPEPVGVGTRYRARWDGGPEMSLEVIEHDAPARWTTRALAAPMTMLVAVRLVPTDTGCRLTARMEITPRGTLRLASPLLRRQFAAGQRRNSELIKAYVEGADGRGAVQG